MKDRQLQNIEKQLGNADEEIKILRKSWAKEISELSHNPAFDPYSKKGEAKLADVAEKYAELIVDAENRYDNLVDLYNKRAEELEAEGQNNN